ncbi:MAG: hypothetical protein AAF823_12055 [Planctomycetota bacterium]
MKTYFDSFVAELKANRSKAATLGVVAVVGLLLWGRLLIKDVPRVATAVPEPVAVAPAPSAPPTPQQQAAKTPNDSTIRLTVPPGLPRDLFGHDPSRYRPNEEAANDDSSAKLLPRNVDDEIRVERVKAEARTLTLQSVVDHASGKQAFISGRLVRVGESIEGFEVVSVQERSVVVKKNDILIRIGL